MRKQLRVADLFLVLLVASLMISCESFAVVSGDGGSWVTFKHDPARSGSFSDAVWGWEGRTYYDYVQLWNFTADLCVASSPVIADLDGDGMNDISVASCDGFEYAVRGVDGSLLWKVETSGGLANPSVADLDGDSIPEVVVAGASGNLYCIYGRSGSVEWVVEGFFQGATTLVSDVDGDGDVEVVANGLDGKVIVVGRDGTVEHVVEVGKEAVSAPAAGDVDGDGSLEVVVGEGHFINIVKFVNGSPRVFTVELPAEVHGSPSLHDASGDGVLDIFVVSGSDLLAIDFLNRRIIWEAPISGDVYSSPSFGDVDGDGDDEVLVSSTDGLFVFGIDGSVKAALTGVNAGFASPIIGDVDGDGRNEVIVARYDGELDILDLSNASDFLTAAEGFFQTNGPLMATPAVGDVDGDGLPEIVVGSRDFRLYCIDGLLTEPVPQQTVSAQTTSQNEVTQRTTTTSTVAAGNSGGSQITVSPGPAPREFRPNLALIASLVVGGAVIIALAYVKTRE